MSIDLGGRLPTVEELQEDYFERQRAYIEGRQDAVASKARQDSDDAVRRAAEDGDLRALELVAQRHHGPAVMAKAFVHWVKTGQPMDIFPGRDGVMRKAAMVEDAIGSVLVPIDVAIEIASIARTAGTIRSLCTPRPTIRNKVRTGLLSAATVGWGRLETGTAATDANTTPSASPAADIEVFDVTALAKIGVDELSDAPTSAEAAIVDAVGSAIADAEDLAFAAGTGSGQPAGLTLAANITRIPAGQKLTAASPVTAANLRTVPFLLPARYRAGAVWLMSTDAASAVSALTGTGGDLLWPEPGPNGRGLLGWPAFEIPGLPAMTGTNAPSILFVNLAAAYRIVDRQPQLSVQRLEQRFADAGQIGLLVKHRTGGDLVRPDAVAAYLL